MAGEQTLYVPEGNEQSVSISSITVHKDFNSYSKFNDIALLFLSSPITLNAYVQPIYLAIHGQDSSGTCTLTGIMNHVPF